MLKGSAVVAAAALGGRDDGRHISVMLRVVIVALDGVVPFDLSTPIVNIRVPGRLYTWEFQKGSREIKVRVEGQLVVNGVNEMLNAARAGVGLGFVPEDLAEPYVAKGQFRRVLDDWCPPFPGFHLYYPSRRQSSLAFSLLVDALRYRPSAFGATDQTHHKAPASRLAELATPQSDSWRHDRGRIVS